MYNTGNPLGSTAPKDFSDNAEITDRYVNDVVNKTTQDRFGRSRLNLHGIEKKADAIIANLGFFPPVDYTSGLNVDSKNYTVTYNDVVYAAQPSAVPFTTGVWDAAQWYPIQNVLNQKNLLVFDTYAEASAAAATLPDGQTVSVRSNDSVYVVSSNSLAFDGYVKSKRFVDITDKPFFATTADTPAELSSKINSALLFVGETGGIVYAPSGLWVTGSEIKVPPHVTLYGAGIDKTIIKCIDGMPVSQNVITNTGNTREQHAWFDESICVRDMTVDANWQNRSTSEATLNQGCCVKLAAVQNFLIKNVRAINGVLHCIDISASVYLNDGSILSQPEGPSLYGRLENCHAENPNRDDGITTHNSGFIYITNCSAFRDRDVYGPPGSTQQGIEVDEGSYYVTVENCLSDGFAKGFQAKGHSTTYPASNITFRRCVAKRCAWAFTNHHVDGTHGHSILIEDCEVRELIGDTNWAPKILSCAGYVGTKVKNLHVYDFNRGVMSFEGLVQFPIIDGVFFHSASTLTSADDLGLIHTYASVAGGTLTVKNVFSLVPQQVPIVRASSSSTILNIDNIVSDATAGAISGDVPMVWHGFNRRSRIQNLTSSNWAACIGTTSAVNKGYAVGGAEQTGGIYRFVIGSGTPEGVVMARVGSRCTHFVTGNEWVLRGANNEFRNTGWQLITPSA